MGIPRGESKQACNQAASHRPARVSHCARKVVRVCRCAKFKHHIKCKHTTTPPPSLTSAGYYGNPVEITALGYYWISFFVLVSWRPFVKQQNSKTAKILWLYGGLQKLKQNILVRIHFRIWENNKTLGIVSMISREKKELIASSIN